MKKILLLSAILFLGVHGMKAESTDYPQVYAFDEMGDINGISDNGQYGALTDPDNGLAYIWTVSNPEVLTEITAVGGQNFNGTAGAFVTTANDVSDAGVVVGSVLMGENFIPAYYKDGQWNLLPLHLAAKANNEAVCITPDGSVIAGYQFINDPSADIKGHYYPCQWFLNDEGGYDLKTYTDIDLPDHQGFFPMTQTPDGEVIAGTVYCGIQSMINAILKNGKLILFDEIVTKNEVFEYKGKYSGEDENGKQIWLDDINDPRVKYFPEVYIDGYRDSQALMGFFTNCDSNGNLYGARNRVENVDEEGNGEVYMDACIYNYKTDTWYTDSQWSAFSAGIGDETLFTLNGTVIKDGEVTDVQEAYDVWVPGTVEGINKISADATVLGGVSSEFFEGLGVTYYYPFFVVTGEGSGVDAVAGDPKKGLVVTYPGRIDVLNADEIAVYDLDGRLVGSDKVNYVNPGIYVVKAGDATYKVIVR